MDTFQELSEEMTIGDYLQDPDMWADRLPQPYRLIDKILQEEVLEAAWVKIQSREIQKRQEAAAGMKVSSGTRGKVVCKDTQGGVCCGKDIIIVGNGRDVLVLAYGTDKEIITKLSMAAKINSIKAIWKNDVHIIFIQLAKEIKILGLIGTTTLMEVVEISYQYKEETAGIMETTLSHTSSHMGITFSCCHSENSHTELKLGIYSLPVESWFSELSQTIKLSEGSQDITYSRPVLQCMISPPLPITPSSRAANPHIIFQSVCDESKKDIVPSGDLHSLTEVYFNNRRKMFVSKRQEFVSKYADTAIWSLCKPTCHFLYPHKLASPFHVAVWWEETIHLTLYRLEDSNKCTTPSANRCIPQAATIICSTVTTDTSQLALGLKSGTVILLDIKMGMYTKVVHCIDIPDSISTLKFFHLSSPAENGLMLGVGTEQGRVLAISMAENDNPSVISLSTRMHKQDVYGKMFTSSGYDICSEVRCILLNPHISSLLTTVHADGTLMLWDPVQQEAVCRFQLDDNYVISSPLSCTFSSNGRHIFIAGKDKDLDSICNVICFDLTTSSIMKVNRPSTGVRELEGKTKQKMGLLDGAEAYLEEYLQFRFLEKDNHLIRWEERWKELPNILIKQTS